MGQLIEFYRPQPKPAPAPVQKEPEISALAILNNVTTNLGADLDTVLVVYKRKSGEMGFRSNVGEIAHAEQMMHQMLYLVRQQESTLDPVPPKGA